MAAVPPCKEAQAVATEGLSHRLAQADIPIMER